MNRMIVAGFTRELCLETFLMNFTLVSLQRRGVASFVITSEALIELDFFMDSLSVTVQSVFVERSVVTFVATQEDSLRLQGLNSHVCQRVTN